MPYELTQPIEAIQEKFKHLNHPRDVAALLEIEYSRLVYHLYKVPESKRYTTFTIPKKSGGARIITAPVSSLKIIQRKLSFILNSVVEPKHSAHGFVRGRNIRTNAAVHAGKSNVFIIDLQEFFPSINFGRVRGMFMAPPFKFNDKVATVLAQACTFKDSLPQGAPTSPVISNLICRKMDQQLSRLARDRGCGYTRYADDITFSTKREAFPKSMVVTIPDSKEALCGDELSRIISMNGFAVNPKKVRLINRCRQQRITGLVSNQFPNVDRRYIRHIRAMLYAVRKFDWAPAEVHFHTKYFKHINPARRKPSFKKVLRGKIDFVGMIRGRLDDVYLSLIRRLQALDPSLVPKLPSPTWINEIKGSLFVIDVERTDGILMQGTGFLLKDIGLVTCSHVIQAAKTIDVYQGSNPSKRYPVTTIRHERGLDFAILRITGFAGRELVFGDDGVVREDSEILLAGYPDYAPGNSGVTRRGRIVATKLDCGRRRFLIDAHIAPGNSGGPVLDNKRRVIGIAAKGDGGENSVIPISALSLGPTKPA